MDDFHQWVIHGRVVHGNGASARVLEKCGYTFVNEEFGAEDDPYGNGMLVYKKVKKGVNWVDYKICEERITADEYIEFLKRSDLGTQYPKERFRERIETLVSRVAISLVARDEEKNIIGVCCRIGLAIF